MWSISLIVGIAVTASLALLVTGVGIAIAIERRRYRRYVQRHTAATPLNLACSTRSLNNVSCCPPHNISLRRAALEASPRTWAASPSSEMIERPASAVTILSTTNPITTKEHSVHLGLGSPSRRKCPAGRRLKKKARLTNMVDPPPSATSEESSQSGISSLGLNSTRTGASTLDLNPSERIQPSQEQLHSTLGQRKISIRVTSNANSNAIERVSSSTRSREPYSSNPTDFTCSTTNSSSPSLCATKISREQESAVDAGFRPDVLSKNTSSSNRLLCERQSSQSRLHKDSETIDKTQSQALQDFDFGLGPIMRLRSPLHPMHLDLQNSRAAATLIFRASKSPNLDLDKWSSSTPAIHLESSHLMLATERASSFATGPVGRHSMFERTHRTPPTHLMRTVWCCNEKDDPFVESIQPRPISTAGHLQLSAPYDVSSSQQAPSQPVDNSGQHRQSSHIGPLRPSSAILNCSTLSRSRIPVPSSRLLLTPTSQKDSAQPSWLQESKWGSKAVNQNLFAFGLSGTQTSSPATPDLNNIHEWRFDPMLQDTPRINVPSSPPQSHHSPVLPSPAYSSSRLRTHLSSSQVRGPRNLPGSRAISKNPKYIRSRIPGPGSTSLSICTNSKPHRDVAPGNSCRPHKLHRNMASDAEILSSASNSVHFRFDGPMRIKQQRISSPTKQDHIPHKQPRTPSTLPQVTLNLLSQPFLQVPKESSEQRLSASTSVRSTGGASVWDDASIHDESSEPEMPSLTPTMNEANASRDTMQAPGGTPRTKVEDYEAYENFVQNYGRTSIGWLNANKRSTGLGVQLSGTLVPDTPRSMYDESGFLKE